MLDELDVLRSTLSTEIERVENRTDEIRKDIFEARLGEPLPASHAAEVAAFSETIKSLSTQMRALYLRAQQTFEPRADRRSRA